MDATRLKTLVSELWGCVAVVEGCATKTGNSTMYLANDRLALEGPYGYGEFMLPEEIRAAQWFQVPGVEVKKVLDALNTGEVLIQISEGQVRLRCGKFHAKIPILGEAGPEERSPQTEGLTMPQEVWYKMVQASEFAQTSGSSQMPGLDNIYWGPEGILACNRISMIHFPTFTNERPLLIPRTVLMGINRISQLPQALYDEKDSLAFQWDNGIVFAPKISGDFPVDMLISILDRNTDRTWTCEQEVLAAAVERASKLDDRLQLEFQPTRLLLRTMGNIQSQEIVAGTMTGEPMPGRLVANASEIKRLAASSASVDWKMNDTLFFQAGKDFQAATALTLASAE